MVYVTLVVTGLFLAFLERFPGLRFRRMPFFRHFFASDVFYLLTGFVAGTSLTYAFIISGSAALGSIGIPRLSTLDVPAWISVSIALIAFDFGNYVAHSLMHKYDTLWEIHKVHHSSRGLDWLATFRSHILEQTLRRLLAPFALIVVGVPLQAVTIAGCLFYAWGMFIHSNLSVNLRAIETVLVTPRLHRVHHDANAANMNLGTLLIVWDRLFGKLSFQETPADVIFGVPGEVDSYPQDWWAQLREPLRRTVQITRTA